VRIHLDFETYALVSVVDVGIHNYMRPEVDFEVLLTALSIDDLPIVQYEGIPVDVLRPLAASPHVSWHAFNAGFERGALAFHGIHVPNDRWRCTLAHSYARGFTNDLDAVGKQVGIEHQKLKAAGTRLINKFSMPRKPTKNNPATRWAPEAAPEAWEEFKEYNRVDVLAEREIWRYLQQWPWTEQEQADWELDQWINARGVPVDVLMAEAAVAEAARYEERYVEEARKLTGGIRPKQTAALLAWCREQGYPHANLQADTIRQWLADNSGDTRS